MPHVLTANRLTDGIVVYRREHGGWTELLSSAALARTDDEGTRLREAGTQAVANHEVVDPYLIEIIEQDGVRRPARLREAIRAGGPTVETAPETPRKAG